MKYMTKTYSLIFGPKVILVVSSWNCHPKLYKSSHNSKGNRIIFKDCLRVLKISYELFDWKFSVKTIPLTLNDHNFLDFDAFLSIFSAPDALLFGQHKQSGPSAQSASKPCLKCWDTGLPTLCGGLHMFFQHKQRNNVWGFDWLLLLKCSSTALVTNGVTQFEQKNEKVMH